MSNNNTQVVGNPASQITAKELLSQLHNSRRDAAALASSSPQMRASAAVPNPVPLNLPSADLNNNTSNNPQLKRRFSLKADAGFTNFTSGIKAGWQRELRSRKFRQAVLAEIVASFLFVAFGTCTVIYSNSGATNEGMVNLLVISSVFGFMIATLVYAVGDISGANINAAVSISLFISRKISLLRCFFYVLAQCIGATLGSAFVRGMNATLFDEYKGASNAVNWAREGTSYWTALSGEALCTSLLILVVHAAADVGREAHTKFVGAMTPLAIGLAVFLSHLILIPITGCSINPSRSFGSSLVSNNWSDHWVFWIGPIGGGIISCLVYEVVFKTPLTPPSAPGGEGIDYGSVVTPSISRENSSADLSTVISVDKAIAAHMASEAALLPKAALLGNIGDTNTYPRSVYLSTAPATGISSNSNGLTYRGTQPSSTTNTANTSSVLVNLTSFGNALAATSTPGQTFELVPKAASNNNNNSDDGIKEW